MAPTDDYPTKFQQIAPRTAFGRLPEAGQSLVRTQAIRHRFTLQELRLVTEIALDLEMWPVGDIVDHWPDIPTCYPDKNGKKRLLATLKRQWEQLRLTPNRYPEPTDSNRPSPKVTPVIREKGKLGLGFCPVASPKTRCCNLMTLDTVDNCGFACSYCSIQSFFPRGEVFFDPSFPAKLAALYIEPEGIYHIGTGQSSDSLLWGNSHQVLDALIAFAERHPNVILELKTKSANVGHLLRRRLPANMLCTWSLNTEPVIAHEEQGSASLEGRLQAARQLADRGALIGFHFHPMVHYQGWEEDYARVFEQVQRDFQPDEVAMVSLGTLTFTRPVLRKIRERGTPSQILKMPLVEADGKLSYPEETKLELFTQAYQSFSETWRNAVFFYLCMENHRFWKPVFGFDYPSNTAFETAMKASYLSKINRKRANPMRSTSKVSEGHHCCRNPSAGRYDE